MKKLRVGKFKIIIQESSENPPQGVIIDVYKEPFYKFTDPVESFTLWYDDYDIDPMDLIAAKKEARN
jgi:hypothetical protein